jgi:hypothetical protein
MNPQAASAPITRTTQDPYLNCCEGPGRLQENENHPPRLRRCTRVALRPRGLIVTLGLRRTSTKHRKERPDLRAIYRPSVMAEIVNRARSCVKRNSRACRLWKKRWSEHAALSKRRVYGSTLGCGTDHCLSDHGYGGCGSAYLITIPGQSLSRPRSASWASAGANRIHMSQAIQCPTIDGTMRRG